MKFCFKEKINRVRENKMCYFSTDIQKLFTDLINCTLSSLMYSIKYKYKYSI